MAPNISELVAVPLASMRVCAAVVPLPFTSKRRVDPAVVFRLRERDDLERLADLPQVHVAHFAAPAVGQDCQARPCRRTEVIENSPAVPLTIVPPAIVDSAIVAVPSTAVVRPTDPLT